VCELTEELSIEYDEESDTAYLRIKGEGIARSEEVAPGLIIEYNSKGQVVGLKLLNASRSEEGLRQLFRRAADSILRDLRT